ncbi:hypothetical protein SARC_05149 [Sphaeroforma arctica JP610]|uniref:Complex 1 LYR protein domain-containing protein n=1 Tax=Sphaeroforma arctica JP610 TaxID=667725 RepID=A0A0L0G0K1_9EUKA|nr:hypothetical protein SARC_05149 [Sphaeroforma arctica JP610]KNC82575.1 hypothetical protein SARC_05149 [Sphaeroforma arctica JP610]|eukprot:XP_014156477.1 hypothetical protein SARC_05149 [Sphaeroforma arctica JP610]
MSRFSRAPIGFKQFMLSITVRTQYRTFMRELLMIKDLDRREEIRLWVRGEYERNRKLSDEIVIKHHLKAGEEGLQELKDTIRLTGMGL